MAARRRRGRAKHQAKRRRVVATAAGAASEQVERTFSTIDFCAVSADLARLPGVTCEIDRGLWTRSDHRPLSLRIPESAGQWLTFVQKPPSLTGWKPQDVKEFLETRLHLLDACGLDLDADPTARPPCRAIQLALEKAAATLDPWAKFGNDSSGNAHWTPTYAEHRLRGVERELAETPQESEAAAALRKSAWRLRRRIGAERRSARLRIATASPWTTRFPHHLWRHSKTGEREKEENVARWPAIVSAHFARRFEATDQPATDWAASVLSRWRSRARAQRLDAPHGSLPALSREQFDAALDKVRLAAATGSDGVPAALLACGGETFLGVLYRAVRDRIRGVENEPVESWARSAVVLLPKKGDLGDLDRWRPITLVGAFYKVYEICAWTVAEQSLRPLPGSIWGFRPGRQALDVVGALAWGFRRAAEWDQELYLASLDVEGAFDAMRAELLGAELEQRGAPASAVEAILAEMVGMEVTTQFAGSSAPPFFPRRGARQGGPKSPAAWNNFVAGKIEDLERSWGDDPAIKWVDVPELQRAGLFVWADNLFVVSDSWDKLCVRLREVEAKFGELDLRFSTSSLEVLASPAGAARPRAPARFADGRAFTEKDAIVVLGIKIDSRASTDTMLQHRLAAARAMWTRVGGMLANRRLPWTERARRMYTSVGASLLWGAGIWTLSQNLQNKISAQETRWLRWLSGHVRATGLLAGLAQAHQGRGPPPPSAGGAPIPLAAGLRRGLHVARPPRPKTSLRGTRRCPLDGLARPEVVGDRPAVRRRLRRGAQLAPHQEQLAAAVGARPLRLGLGVALVGRGPRLLEGAPARLREVLQPPLAWASGGLQSRDGD